jgi:hypothetical protein
MLTDPLRDLAAAQPGIATYTEMLDGGPLRPWVPLREITLRPAPQRIVPPAVEAVERPADPGEGGTDAQPRSGHPGGPPAATHRHPPRLPGTPMTRHLRHALVASAAALVAGVTALLALAAAQEAWTSRGAAVLLALAAVWLSQGIRPLLTHRRHHQ